MALVEAALNACLDALTIDRVNIHDGDPGTDGTANVVGTKTACVFNAASGGIRTLNADVDFTGLTPSANVTWFSIWKNAGTVFWGAGEIVLGDTVASSAGAYRLKATTTQVSLT